MTDFPVTGGDLFVLWHAAHHRLPEAKAVYDDTLATEKNELANGDEEKFGRPFSAWLRLLSANQYLMQRSSLSIEISCQALDQAIEQYKYVDGDNSKSLTKAGEDLNGLVEKDKKGRDDD